MKRTTIHRRARGAALIWMALMVVMLIAVAGIGTDAGYLMITAHQLQNAADSSALAAVQKVSSSQSQARDLAVEFAALHQAAGAAVSVDRNDANNADGDVVLGVYSRTDQTFTATTSSPNAVKVMARRIGTSPAGPVALFFGPMFHVDSAEVYRSAIAMVSPGTSSPPGILVLGSSGPDALKFDGGPTLTVINGNIQVNSSDASAVRATGSGYTISFSELDVVGGTSFSNKITVNGTVKTGVASVADPLAKLAAPTAGLDLVGGKFNSNHTFVPGYYSKGIVMTGGTATLLPGTYILGSPGLKTSGSTTGVSGNGVTLYLADGSLDLNGGGASSLSPGNSGTYAGILVFQARGNTSTANIANSGTLSFFGVIYMPDAPMVIGSNSTTVSTLGSQLLVKSVDFKSNSKFQITYGTRFGGATPAVSFLVK